MKTIKVQMDDIWKDKRTHTPIFNYCRKLIKDGEKPNTKLEVYRNNYKPDVVINHIGKGAKLTVHEEPKMHFALYVPFPEEKRASVRIRRGPNRITASP